MSGYSSYVKGKNSLVIMNTLDVILESSKRTLKYSGDIANAEILGKHPGH